MLDCNRSLTAAEKRRGAALLADPLYRLSCLYWIRTETGVPILFRPNWAQQNFLEEMSFLNIILKARQLGFTTVITLFMLDACIFNSGVSAGIIADTETKAQEIFRDKIKFAYERMPGIVRGAVETTKDSVYGYEFANGSSIHVGTSMRGLVKQYLLVSELGKIAAHDPAKANEIKTGSFNTVHAGQFLFVESTAKGREGLFYDLCNTAQDDKRMGRPITPLTFKFHFYPWYLDERYVLEGDMAQNVVITKGDAEYFAKIEAEMDVELTPPQRAWYVEKKRVQKEDMKSEFPSTPDEAFEVSGEGRIYRLEMAKVREEQRILPRIPVLPNMPVDAFFDIGGSSGTKTSDYMACWFVQRVGMENRILRYHRDTGRGIGWWATYLRSHGYLLRKIYLPHDGKHKRLVLADAGKSVEDLFVEAGFRPIDIVIVPRVEDKWHDGIGQVRNVFPTCVFDAENCDQGIKDLDNYKKVWNDQLGVWRDQPAHDPASHGSDAFETFARSEVALGAVMRTGTTRKKKRARNFKTV